MQLLSTYIVVLFFFTFLASGGPIPGTDPQAKQDLQAQPHARTFRRKYPHRYSDEEKSLLRELTLLLCAHRMLYRNFPVTWVGEWPVPSWDSKKPGKFVNYVNLCVPLAFKTVMEWSEFEYNKPAFKDHDTRNGPEGVKDLCQRYRCKDPNFGGMKMNAPMPKEDSQAFRECEAECTRVYTSLEEAVEDGKLQLAVDKEFETRKAFTKENIERAVEVVQEVAGKADEGGGNKPGEGGATEAGTVHKAGTSSEHKPPKPLVDRFKA
ncbi:hypothetical protein F5887DRAFT_181195 [Amanita rubescens]|nr:hypothetical protein F5887DRAFT_181195 [Amanita rubescens]